MVQSAICRYALASGLRFLHEPDAYARRLIPRNALQMDSSGRRSFASLPDMKREFNVIIEQDAEGYYVASAPELSGCHTQARSLDKLLSRIKEAIELCLEVQSPIL